MAKRKKEDPVAGLLTAGLFLLIAVTFLTTQSFVVTMFTGFISFMAILLLLNNARVKRERRIRNSGILEIDQMTGVQFEEYLKLFFSSVGFHVKTTPATGDFGADLILEMNGNRIVVQAKRYKSNVGIKAVQEVVSAKLHYRANETWVITNSQYTKAAQELAESNGVKLIGRNQLIEMMTAQANRAKGNHPSVQQSEKTLIKTKING